MLIETRNSPYAKVYQPDAHDVRWTGGLWKERTDTCATVTLPNIRSLFEDNDPIFHVVENFRIACGDHEGAHHGTPFGDGDFYKWMEGAMYSLLSHPDPALEADLDQYIDLIGRCIQPDGYLSTKQIIGEKNGDISRLSDINDFEVYNFGHLFTSACMYKRITGKNHFLNIAIKAADYLKTMYEEAARTGDVQTAVCPSHYMGLVELYRTTGNKDYLDTAALAIALRDRVKNGTDDNQDRLPLREQKKILGHAVRSTYLYAGVADLFLENGDETLLPVLHRLWENCVNSKLYITGGCGALYNGSSPYGVFRIAGPVHQAFGYEYQLPNVTAYNETCAALGNVFWNMRLFAIEPNAKYLDVIERTMLNVALAAVSLQGDAYFYENTLRRTKGLDYEVVWPLERVQRLTCFCCPPNLARTIAQSSELAYFLAGNTVWFGLYGANTFHYTLANGSSGTLVQETDYPYDGKIMIHFNQVENNAPLTLNLRIPSWFNGGTLTVNDCALPIDAKPCSFMPLHIDDPKSTTVTIDFKFEARLTIAHAKLEEDTNQAAVERGPLVYCIETPDADLETLDDIMLPSNAVFHPVQLDIDGRTITALTTDGIAVHREDFDPDALYQTLPKTSFIRQQIRLIPYFAWDNRGNGEMKIWLPVCYTV